MATFLLKTEPGEYSYDDLVRDKGTVWNGISNAAALIHLRSMKKGDEAFIYHTGDERSIVGLAVCTRGAYPDPESDNEKLVAVDLKARKKARRPVTLAELKADKRFAAFALVKQGRLSVMSVPPDLDGVIRSMAGLE